jgi:acetyl-CoA C-acetyltransferase
MPQAAYIVDALRTPTGKRRGSLAEAHPIDMGAHVIKSLVSRNAIPHEDYDDVIFGIIDAIGPQAGNIGRYSWLCAGFDEGVPGVTIDRQCGSSQQAVHFAAQAIMSGVQDVVIAGGVQQMSCIPIGSASALGKEFGFAGNFTSSASFMKRYGEVVISQFVGAEMMAREWGFSREDMEAYALESNRRALQAIGEGRFTREVVPFMGLAMDETARETSLAKMAELKLLSEGGRITAATASQQSDGASAVLVCSEAALKRYHLKPRARIVHMAVRGADPVMMLSAPIPATRHALKKSGLKLEDIDIAEVNEAFAPVPMAWMKDIGFPHERTNVNGGAIALGHPIGATGTKLMTTLLHELERRGGRYGLQTMCEGGGVANVTIIERL